MHNLKFKNFIVFQPFILTFFRSENRIPILNQYFSNFLPNFYISRSF